MFKGKKAADVIDAITGLTSNGIRINFKTPDGFNETFGGQFIRLSDRYPFMDEIDACGWDVNSIIDVCKKYRVHSYFDTPVYSVLRNTQNEIVIQLDSAGDLVIFRKDASVNAGVKKVANTYQDALNLPAYNMDAYIQSAAECVNAVFSGAELLEQAATWAEYNADGPSMEFADKIGDMAAEAYVIGKDFADAWDAGARGASRKLAFDDAPEYAIADKYRDFDDALQYVNMSDDEIIRESAKHAAYEWFGWSGSFNGISDSHFQTVVWNGIDRVARNIFSAQERVKVGVETNDEWRALKNEDPEAWETLRDDLGTKIDERCAAIEPIVSQLVMDAIEDCRARIESI